jgi:hypothetical protein
MRECSVCIHPQRDEIERQLSFGTSYRDIAGQFEISKSALERHKVRHVSKLAEYSPEAIINCVAISIPLVEGDLTTKALMGITNLGPLSVVLCMKELGYKSRHKRDCDRWVWEKQRAEGTTLDTSDDAVEVVFLRNHEQHGSQARAMLPEALLTRPLDSPLTTMDKRRSAYRFHHLIPCGPPRTTTGKNLQADASGSSLSWIAECQIRPPPGVYTIFCI